MSKLFTANRVVALTGFATSLGALVASFVGVFPSGWQNAALAGVAILGKTGIVLKFLTGSQQWDKLTNSSSDMSNAVPPIDQGLSEIEALEQSVAAFQQKAGTPAEQVTAGLSPTTAPAVVPPVVSS